VLKLIKETISFARNDRLWSRRTLDYEPDIVLTHDFLQFKSFVKDHRLPSDQKTRDVLVLFVINNVASQACYNDSLIDRDALAWSTEFLAGNEQLEWGKIRELVSHCVPVTKEWLAHFNVDGIRNGVSFSGDIKQVPDDTPIPTSLPRGE
jgi:hypothetical protein